MNDIEINITTGHIEDRRIAFVYNPKTNTIAFNTGNRNCDTLRDITKMYLEMTDSQLKAFKEGIKPKKELNEYLHTIDHIRRYRRKIQSHRA